MGVDTLLIRAKPNNETEGDKISTPKATGIINAFRTSIFIKENYHVLYNIIFNSRYIVFESVTNKSELCTDV
jgi:hypothetical protein